MALVLLGAGCAYPIHTTAPPPDGAFASVPPILRQNTGTVSTLDLEVKYAMDLTVDDAGTIYVAGLDAIRKFTPDGKATVLAGAANGALSAPGDEDIRIVEPRGIATDRQGNVYVSGTHRLYKLAPDGKLTIVCALDLDGSTKIAVDSRGNIFVLYEHQDRIEKVTPDGTRSDFAGRWVKDAPPGLVGSGYQDGPGAQALFRMPSDIAIDENDTLYVADTNNSAVRKIDPTGKVTTLVGAGRDEPIPPSPSPGGPIPDYTRFAGINAESLAVDRAGRLYAACADNRVRIIGPEGSVSVMAGDGTLCPAMLTTGGGPIIVNNSPGPAPSPSPSPTPTPTCYQDGASGTARFDAPRAIGVDGTGRVYVLDGGSSFANQRIRKID